MATRSAMSPDQMLRLPHGVVTARPRYHSPVDDGPAELGDLLMRVARTQRRRWRDVLAPWDLSPHQARALEVVSEHDGVRLSDLAEALRIAPRSATEVADGLQERGLVERTPDPATGGRCSCGPPTRAGGSAAEIGRRPRRRLRASSSPACRPRTATRSPGSCAPSPTEDEAARHLTSALACARVAEAVTRRQVLAFRVRAQQLDRDAGTLDDTAVLDLGVQDTGTDGARWALALRGVDVDTIDEDELATVWTHPRRPARLPPGRPARRSPPRPRRSPTPTPASASSTPPSR